MGTRDTLSNGWHLLGSSDSVNDISIFKDIKKVYIYNNANGYTLLHSKGGSSAIEEDESPFIEEYSGFWIDK